MIPTLFLSAALALPAPFSGSPPQDQQMSLQVYHTLVSMWSEVYKKQRPHHLRFLFSSEDFWMAMALRNQGISTFVLGARKANADFNVIGTYLKMPFRQEVFNIVTVTPDLTVDLVLHEAWRVLIPFGFLVAPVNGNGTLQRLIESFGFEMLPMSFDDDVKVYQKIGNLSVVPPTKKKKKKSPIGTRSDRWVMMQALRQQIELHRRALEELNKWRGIHLVYSRRSA